MTCWLSLCHLGGSAWGKAIETVTVAAKISFSGFLVQKPFVKTKKKIFFPHRNALEKLFQELSHKLRGRVGEVDGT